MLLFGLNKCNPSAHHDVSRDPLPPSPCPSAAEMGRDQLNSQGQGVTNPTGCSCSSSRQVWKQRGPENWQRLGWQSRLLSRDQGHSKPKLLQSETHLWEQEGHKPYMNTAKSASKPLLFVLQYFLSEAINHTNSQDRPSLQMPLLYLGELGNL